MKILYLRFAGLPVPWTCSVSLWGVPEGPRSGMPWECTPGGGQPTSAAAFPGGACRAVPLQTCVCVCVCVCD